MSVVFLQVIKNSYRWFDYFYFHYFVLFDLQWDLKCVAVCIEITSLSDRAVLWRGGGGRYEQTSPDGVLQKV